MDKAEMTLRLAFLAIILFCGYLYADYRGTFGGTIYLENGKTMDRGNMFSIVQYSCENGMVYARPESRNSGGV